VQFLRLDVEPAMEPDRHRERYLLLDELIGGSLAR
jgi:hypothetical protein